MLGKHCIGLLKFGNIELDINLVKILILSQKTTNKNNLT